jgi:hypothetical protein
MTPRWALDGGEIDRETAVGSRSTQIEADGAAVPEVGCCEGVAHPARLERELSNIEEGG